MIDGAGDLTALGAVWLFLAHRVGDWLLQNNWMAVRKTSEWFPALLHGAVYAVAFVPLCGSVWAWLAIAGSHAVIDRFRLARHVTWASNQVGPRADRYPYRQRHQFEGSKPGALPDHVAFCVRVETDATLHHLCNLAAVVLL